MDKDKENWSSVRKYFKKALKIDYYKIKKGFILLELSGIEKKIIYTCLKLIKHKLPGKFIIIKK